MPDANIAPLADPKVIGATLKAWRIVAGWTQEDAGEIVGIGQSPWSRIETGDRNITLAEAAAFANAVGVSIEALRFRPIDLLQVFVAGPALRAMQEAADDG